MPMRALTLAEAAAELGRSPDWLRANWQRLADDPETRFPAPIHEFGTLVWNAAQLFAWLDRERPMRERAFAAAFRAAYDAASRPADPAIADEVSAARERLNRRFPKEGRT